MFSVFLIFITELIAHRAGAAYLRRQGLRTHDPHTADGADISHTTHGVHVEERTNPEGALSASENSDAKVDEEAADHGHAHAPFSKDAMAQILGTVILEFGVIFHSFIIGLTLAVSSYLSLRCRVFAASSLTACVFLKVVADFPTLFVVLVFHRASSECRCLRISPADPVLDRSQRCSRASDLDRDCRPYHYQLASTGVCSLPPSYSQASC